MPDPSTADVPSRRIHSGRAAILIVAAVVVVTLSVDLVFARRNRNTAIEKDRAAKAYVDPSRTAITWKTLPDGVEQHAVAAAAVPDDERDDVARLIQVHTRELLIQRRNVGDYGTAAFAGVSMPGRDELEQDAGAIDVVEQSLPDGAALRYTTAKPNLRLALQKWADAQAA